MRFRRLLLCFLTIAIGAAGLGAAPAGRAATVVPPGCSSVDGLDGVLDCLVPSPVDVGAVDRRVRVILPASYGVAPVPVVYLFHGVGDTYRTWVQNTDIETFAPAHGALVVMPDGGRTPEAGWYSDWKDGSRSYETFHVDVLIPWVEQTFSTLTGRQHRATAGLSMGGFGALSYAARNPDTFGAAASFSGLLDTQVGGPALGVAYGMGTASFGTPNSRTWGDPVADEQEWSAHNPTALARRGAYDHLDGNLWLTAGTGTPGGPANESPSNPGGYAVEHFVWQTNQQFKVAMLQAGTPFHDLSYLGGLHDWPYWERALRLVLPPLTDAIA